MEPVGVGSKVLERLVLPKSLGFLLKQHTPETLCPMRTCMHVCIRTCPARHCPARPCSALPGTACMGDPQWLLKPSRRTYQSWLWERT
jgi:hypothetical protein